MKPSLVLLTASLLAYHLAPVAFGKDATSYAGGPGPGRGKHIVWLAGDEEYRSEEAAPMLARILAVRHGFDCTVLYPLNPATGTIDPVNQTNIVGLEKLGQADLMVLFWRFREPSDAQMQHFVRYLNAGKPIIGIRTATHAFSYERNKQSPYARYDWRNREWPGGFGRQVLGETWINHHGDHGKESTRGLPNPAFRDHPVLRGVTDVWGPTDVYGVVHLPAAAQVLVHGQVLTGMKPTDPPVAGKKNEPMMPLIWLREYRNDAGTTNRIATSTIGASVDFESEGLRRVLVNAAYWAVGLEAQIPAQADVRYVGDYAPSYFGFGKFKPGLKPEDLELK